jgi:16S rRNA (cytidine1402-2'-O)-methyltransferase
MLTLIATPIGNLSDITLRALEALKQTDAVICEDTRRTAQLLNHYEIKKPLLILNDFNENRNLTSIIERLKQDENFALVSDAGTPLVSDPGYKLVRECLKEGIIVDSLPGAASPIVALTLSGLPPDKFMFLGYIPEKPGARLTLYESIKQIDQITPTTFILFIAPFKLKRVLEEMKDKLSDPLLVLARELTKIHQEVMSKTTSEWLEYYSKREPKGECILLLRLNETKTN